MSLYNSFTFKDIGKNSKIDYGFLPKELQINFEDLWILQPPEKDKFIFFGKETTFPRKHQSYGVDYVFSGKKHKALPIPDILLPIKYFFEDKYGKFDQVLVNWYANGLDYISSHQDNEKQIVENSPIVSISFGQERVFRIRDSNKKIILDTKTEDASFVVMCGEFQKHFWHEIPKVTGKKGESYGPRINITLRQFK